MSPFRDYLLNDWNPSGLKSSALLHSFCPCSLPSSPKTAFLSAIIRCHLLFSIPNSVFHEWFLATTIRDIHPVWIQAIVWLFAVRGGVIKDEHANHTRVLALKNCIQLCSPGGRTWYCQSIPPSGALGIQVGLFFSTAIHFIYEVRDDHCLTKQFLLQALVGAVRPME